MISTTVLMDSTLKSILFLQSLSNTIYPTGSRLWGTAKRDSDFDFFTDIEVEEALKEFGFFELLTDGLDSNTFKIYRKGLVDIALLHNPLKRLQVEAILREDPRLRKMLESATNTNAQKQLWNFYYSTLV